MKRLLALAAAAVTACALAAVPALAATKTVQVKDDYFTPKRMSVSKGTTIRWVWKGKSPHNVTVAKGPKAFNSGYKTSGSYKQKLTKAGRYLIVCTIHSDMEQTVTVR